MLHRVGVEATCCCYRVLFTRAAGLVQSLLEARAQRRLAGSSLPAEKNSAEHFCHTPRPRVSNQL